VYSSARLLLVGGRHDCQRTGLGAILPLLAIASSLNNILDLEGIPKQMVVALTSTFGSGWVMMLGINILLLIVGCLMDTFSAILLFTPLLLPLAVASGWDAIHFGIIMIVNLEIGYLTPPVGLNIIIASIAFRATFGEMIKAVVPFVLLMTAALVVIVAWPGLSVRLTR
jgi:C4-dicarboxylate transporter, DctM subunit